MRTASLSAALLVLLPAFAAAREGTVIELKLVGPVAQRAPAKTETVSLKAEKAEEARRCAFLGMFGSFHLIGAKATAAYTLGNEKFVADLRYDGEDANWWFYSPTGNGDAWTTRWAFARRRDCGGKFSVFRLVNGVWCFYEQTEAWGLGLDRFFGSAAAPVSADGGPSNQELLNKLERIESKLRLIQPNDVGPSLEDLNRRIGSTPPSGP